LNLSKILNKCYKDCNIIKTKEQSFAKKLQKGLNPLQKYSKNSYNDCIEK